jgi:hypothetical protein
MAVTVLARLYCVRRRFIRPLVDRKSKRFGASAAGLDTQGLHLLAIVVHRRPCHLERKDKESKQKEQPIHT